MFIVGLIALFLLVMAIPKVVTNTYARPKAAPTNSTGMVTTLKMGELPGVPVTLDYADAAAVAAAAAAVILGKGTTGNLTAEWAVDATEGGGATDDVQKLFKLTAVLTMGAGTDAKPTLTVSVIPVSMVANVETDGSAQVLVVDHPQTMDVFQAAAGRARQ